MTINEDVKYRFSEQGVSSLAGAFAGMTGVVGRLTSMMNPLTLAIGGIGAAGALAGIVATGSKYEDLRIQMAQTMRFMGRGGANFNEALLSADATMDAINTAAAALPGEAEDYQIALKMAGADVMRATGSYAASFDLIKNMTAIGVTLGRGSMETAQFLSRSMNTQRGMLETGNDYTRTILNSMKQMPGLANITTDTFNKMSLEKRVQIMQGLVGQYGDMISASSTTWTAVSGAFTSVVAKVTRLSGAKVFDGMTKALNTIVGLFADADGKLTAFSETLIQVGSTIGSVIGDAFKFVAEKLKEISEQTRGWLRQLANSPLIAMLDRVGGAAMRMGQAMAERPGGVQQAAVSVGAAGVATAGMASAELAIFGPLGAVLIPLTMGFANFLTNTEAVSATLAAMGTMVEPLVGFLGAAVGAFSSLGGMLGGLLSGLLPGLMAGVSDVVNVFVGFYTEGMSLIDFVARTITPGLSALGRGVGAVVHGLGAVLAPIIRLVGTVLLGIYDVVIRFLSPALNWLFEVVGKVIEVLGDFLTWLGDLLGSAVTAILPTPAAQESDSTRAMRDMLNSFTASLEGAGGSAIGDAAGTAAAAATARPTPGGRGGGVTQDFRNSRFSIQQKFEEGFDPDRIAAAFATDLGRLGERRLQSGLEPAFGVR